MSNQVKRKFLLFHYFSGVLVRLRTAISFGIRRCLTLPQSPEAESTFSNLFFLLEHVCTTQQLHSFEEVVQIHTIYLFLFSSCFPPPFSTLPPSLGPLCKRLIHISYCILSLLFIYILCFL